MRNILIVLMLVGCTTANAQFSYREGCEKLPLLTKSVFNDSPHILQEEREEIEYCRQVYINCCHVIQSAMNNVYKDYPLFGCDSTGFVRLMQEYLGDKGIILLKKAYDILEEKGYAEAYLLKIRVMPLITAQTDEVKKYMYDLYVALYDSTHNIKVATLVAKCRVYGIGTKTSDRAAVDVLKDAITSLGSPQQQKDYLTKNYQFMVDMCGSDAITKALKELQYTTWEEVLALIREYSK